MSKSLKKIIDINRLREFKNKLIGTGSAYVQTGAVDQTVAGTKTFSKPIVGSVTGSSGSCTGNAATATTATTAKACTGNAATATKLATARSLWGNNFDGSAAITGEIVGTPSIELMPEATSGHGGFLDFHYNHSEADHTSRIIESASGTLSINSVTITTGRVVTAKTFNGALTGNVTGNCSGSSGSCTGNAATATKAVSADSATNASHATSADKATKAEQDGNGNNIVASYVAAGSEDDSTADIGAFMAARPSFIKSFVYNNVWTDAISMRHRNGSEDGSNYGTYIRSSTMTGVSNLLWNHQYGGMWQGERTLIDSVNLAGFTKSAITIYDLVPDGAEAHNAMWGGRDITAAFNNGTVSANIANGTFRDIFPGDYITKQVTISGTAYTVNWVIADCDYWWHKGDQNNGMETHHVAIAPQTPIFDARMNSTNTAEGGYASSWIYKNVIPACATGIVNAFGSDHILTFRDHLTRDLNTSAVSSGITVFTGAPNWNGGWYSQQCNLMSEAMVYGGPHCASSALDNIMATRQMSAFRLSERLINYNRDWWWLRDVVSSAFFACAHGTGSASAYYASDVYGVRPFALLV